MYINKIFLNVFISIDLHDFYNSRNHTLKFKIGMSHKPRFLNLLHFNYFGLFLLLSGAFFATSFR